MNVNLPGARRSRTGWLAFVCVMLVSAPSLGDEAPKDGGDNATVVYHERKREPGKAENETWCVAFAPDGKTLASGGRDNSVRVWSAESGNPRATLRGYVEGVGAVAFSPDGQALFTCGGDREVKVWEQGSVRGQILRFTIPSRSAGSGR